MKRGNTAGINSLFERISKHVTSLRFFYLGLILVVTAAALFSARNLEVDNSLDAFLIENDTHFQYYMQFRDEFENDRYVYITYENPFQVQTMLVVQKLGREIRQELTRSRGEGRLVYLKKLLMLPNVEYVEGRDGQLIVSELLSQWDGSQKSLDDLRERVAQKEIYRNILVSKDAGYGAMFIELNKIIDEAHPDDTIYKIITGITSRQEYRDLGLRVVGHPILSASYNRISKTEAIRNLVMSTCLAFFLLWFFFRDITKVMGPLITVGIALAWTIGILPLLHIKFTLILSVLPALLAVVGIGAAIHIVSEFQRKFPVVRDARQAIHETYYLLGLPCFFTAFTTAVGLGSMVVSNLQAIREFALVSAIGVLFTLFLTMFFLPIYLSFDVRARLHRTDPFANRGLMMTGFLNALGRFNERHMRSILVATVLFIGLSVWGMTMLRVDASWIDEFKDSVQIRQDYSFVDKNMGGTGSFSLVFDTGKADGVKDPDFLNMVAQVQEYAMKRDDLVMKAYSVVDFIRDINMAMHDGDPAYFTIPATRQGVSQLLFLYELSGGEELSGLVDFPYRKAVLNIRVKTVATSIWKKFSDDLTAYARLKTGDLAEEKITGVSHLTNVLLHYISKTQIESFSLAFIIITCMLIIVFRSFKLGLFGMIPNLQPIAMTLGVMGFLRVELDFVKLTIACIAIGITVDDTIHFISRYHLEFDRLGDYRKAMYAALNSVGRAMFLTSSILMAGFLVCVFSVMNSFLTFGVLSAFTIFCALVCDYFMATALIMKFQLFGPEKLSGPAVVSS